MRKSILALVLVSVLFLTFIQTAQAAGCQPVYGGGEMCTSNNQFTVKKQVMKPGVGYVDNLSLSDPKFVVGSTITFQIIVQNTGNTTISHLDITDTLPKEILYQTSTKGKYDSTNYRATFGIDNLAAGASQTFELTARVQAASGNQDCPANKASGNDNNGGIVIASSQFCVTQGQIQPSKSPSTPKVYSKPPMKQTPPTGPEDLVFPLLSASGAIGFYLRKKTIK
jgi:uncharacterized repeat protein (TIGR01451 family)